MSKQLSDAPLSADEQITSPTTGDLPPMKKKQPSVFWPWFGGLLVVGLVIVVIVTAVTSNWLNNIQHGIGAGQPSTAATAMNVQRNAIYADLNVTLINVQYATTFNDDPIHSGPATVRATVRVNNPTASTIDIAYYDAVRLLVPGHQPIVPENLSLSAAPQAGKTSTGWIDFPVAKGTALKTLQLQFGNAAVNEMLVTIPVSGAYDASHYNNHTYNQSLAIAYNYGPYGGKHLLNYHLNSVEVRNSYNGAETTAGEQFYVLNFTVDNPNSVWVGPGYGYDYINLVLGSDTPPIDSTLPNGFQHNAHGISGHVTFKAPVGMHALTIAFRAQLYQGQDTYSISW